MHRCLCFTFAVLGLLAPSCTSRSISDSDAQAMKAQIGRVIDALHAAAAKADETAYFGQFASSAVFLGTDPDERWSLDAFKAYARPHFDKGRGWTYVPSDRHVRLGPDGATAWFDEVVTSEKYGRCRGTGVLVRGADGWRIVQYSLSLPIPNDMFLSVAQAIQAGPPYVPESQGPSEVVISLQTDGGRLIDGVSADAAAWARALEGWRRQRPAPTVVLEATPEVPHQRVVRTLDDLKQAGLREVAIRTL